MYFHLLGTHLSAESEDEKLKKYYAKYAPMLAIHVDNHFSDKFVLLCHVGDFVNGDWQKLMVGYICRTFYTFRDYILYFHLSEAHLSANYTLRDKNFVLLSFRDASVSGVKIWKIKKILCQICPYAGNPRWSLF